MRARERALPDALRAPGRGRVIGTNAALCERHAVDVPEADHGQLTTHDAIVAYLAARRDSAGVRPPCRQSCRRCIMIAGKRAIVRPLRAADTALEAEFVRHLSMDARYKRFMLTLRDLPESKLRYLTDVDQLHHVALGGHGRAGRARGAGRCGALRRRCVRQGV